MKDGIYYDLPDKEYRSIEAISSTNMMALVKSVRHYMLSKEKRTATSAMMFGTAFHTFVLEENKFIDEIFIKPVLFKNTNEKMNLKKTEHRKWYDENRNNKTEISMDDYQTLISMKESLMMHTACKKLITKSKHEVAIFWTENIDGVELKCKGKIDIYRDDINLIADLKTSKNPVIDYLFRKTIEQYYYDVQAYFYKRGLDKLTNKNNKTAIIGIEKSPPYICDVFLLENEYHIYNQRIVDDAFSTLVDCIKKNYFNKSYTDNTGKLRTLELSYWRKKILED